MKTITQEELKDKLERRDKFTLVETLPQETYNHAFDVAIQAIKNCSTIEKVFVVSRGNSIDYLPKVLPDSLSSEIFLEFEDLQSFGENPKTNSLEPIDENGTDEYAEISETAFIFD